MSLKLASAAVLVLLLAGCAASPATPTATPADTATPTPTPTAAAVPGPTVPLACSDLFTEAEASALTGETVLAVPEAQLLDNSQAIAARQGGVLECAWSSGGKPEAYYGSPLSLSIIDGEQYFAAGQDPNCYTSSGDSGCRTSELVNGYWLWMNLSSRDKGTDAGVTLDSLLATWATAKEKVTGAIATAGSPLAPWVAPTGAFTGAFCDSRDPGQVYPPSSTGGVAAARVEKHCLGDDDWYVSIVPGGAWALPIMTQTLPPADKEVGNWTPFGVPGADVALRACGEYCVAIISVGGSAVTVSTGTLIDYQTSDGAQVTQFDDAARAVLAQVIAAG